MKEAGGIEGRVLTPLIGGLLLGIVVSPVQNADQVHEHGGRSFHLL